MQRQPHSLQAASGSADVPQISKPEFAQRRRKKSVKTYLLPTAAALCVLVLLCCLPLFLPKRNNILRASSSQTKVPKVQYRYSDDWTFNKMWRNLKCGAHFRKERPIHSQETWRQARRVYEDIVGKESSSIVNQARNGFSVDFEAKQSPPKGRGIFAKQDVTAGSLIWQTKKTARFEHGADYRKFIYSVEPEFACEALQFSYIQDVGDGELRISVDLDEGGLCNDGGKRYGNMGCDEVKAKDYAGGCKQNYFALRDIKAGEELLCWYSSFVISDGWSNFGL